MKKLVFSLKVNIGGESSYYIIRRAEVCDNSPIVYKAVLKWVKKNNCEYYIEEITRKIIKAQVSK